jgi:CubicO group peptidase (beta-lactamase class C family)
MTKPITALAGLLHWERGALDLMDPVSAFIPAFAEARVWTGGPVDRPGTVPVSEPVRLWHLFTHTAGLSYGFDDADPVDRLYRGAGFSTGAARTAGMDPAAFCERLATMPLLFQPGQRWHYSLATDVLGRVVEAVAGRPLDRVFQDDIFTPLGMDSTGFWVRDPPRWNLWAILCRRDPGADRLLPVDGGPVRERPSLHSGGGGLLATAPDDLRFMALLEVGGAVGGRQLVGPRTLRMMTRDVLPPPLDLTDVGQPGVDFGLGLSVVRFPERALSQTSPGTYGWAARPTPTLGSIPSPRSACGLSLNCCRTMPTRGVANPGNGCTRPFRTDPGQALRLPGTAKGVCHGPRRSRRKTRARPA